MLLTIKQKKKDNEKKIIITKGNRIRCNNQSINQSIFIKCVKRTQKDSTCTAETYKRKSNEYRTQLN